MWTAKVGEGCASPLKFFSLEKACMTEHALDIRTWGPKVWDVLHTLTFAYPVQASPRERIDMYKFLYATSSVLPCKRCRRHFEEQLDLHFGTRATSSRWLSGRRGLSEMLVSAHNAVNALKGVPPYDYRRVLVEYDQPELVHAPVLEVPPTRSAVVCCVCVVYVLSIMVAIHVLRRIWIQRQKRP